MRRNGLASGTCPRTPSSREVAAPRSRRRRYEGERSTTSSAPPASIDARPRRLHRRQRRPRALSGGWTQAAGHCARAGRASPTSSSSTSPRTTSTSRASCGSRSCSRGAVRVRRGQPRPLLPRERRQPYGRDRPRLSRRALPQSRARYSDFLEKREEFLRAAGRASRRRSRTGAARGRVAAPRRQGAHDEIEGAHRRGRPPDRRARRPARPRSATGTAEIDFAATERQDQAAARRRKASPRRWAAARCSATSTSR